MAAATDNGGWVREVIRLLRRRTRRWAGGSTGTSLYGASQLFARMIKNAERGSVVTLICDSGERYAGSYDADGWITEQGFDLAPQLAIMEHVLDTGRWDELA